MRVKPFASRRFFNSCAAKRSPFVGKCMAKPLSTSGAESQASLTCDLTSLICVSIDFGILEFIWSKMRDENGEDTRDFYVGVPTGYLCGFEGVRCNPKVVQSQCILVPTGGRHGSLEYL